MKKIDLAVFLINYCKENGLKSNEITVYDLILRLHKENNYSRTSVK
jgi:hypothetical protein